MSTDDTDSHGYFCFKDNKNNTNNMNTRMRRMKLNRGGDGDAHHRSTSDGGCHDKRVYQCKPQSNVRFRTRNRPPPSDFVRIIRKGIRAICGICGQLYLLYKLFLI